MFDIAYNFVIGESYDFETMFVQPCRSFRITYLLFRYGMVSAVQFYD